MTAIESDRRAPARRPTINDVAALSGVSKSTVSNVLREVPNVSPSTRDRVLEAIRVLGYRPNAAARNLVQQRTGSIGVVVGDLANVFIAELVRRMEERASAEDYSTLVCNTGGRPERERARIEALLEQRVDGIALLEFSGDRAVLADLLAARVPVAMVSCWTDYTDAVAIDDHRAVRLAVDHLVELGHDRIGYVADPTMEPTTARARAEALERSLLEHGLRPRPEWLVNTGSLELLTSPDRPAAVVTANDRTALHVMEVVEEAGLTVPGDLSLVGIDGTAIGRHPRIALTTVAQPLAELADVGIGLLLERIDGGDGAPARQRRLEPRLVVRGSAAPPGRARG